MWDQCPTGLFSKRYSKWDQQNDYLNVATKLSFNVVIDDINNLEAYDMVDRTESKIRETGE